MVGGRGAGDLRVDGQARDGQDAGQPPSCPSAPWPAPPLCTAGPGGLALPPLPCSCPRPAVQTQLRGTSCPPPAAGLREEARAVPPCPPGPLSRVLLCRGHSFHHQGDGTLGTSCVSRRGGRLASRWPVPIWGPGWGCGVSPWVSRCGFSRGHRLGAACEPCSRGTFLWAWGLSTVARTQQAAEHHARRSREAQLLRRAGLSPGGGDFSCLGSGFTGHSLVPAFPLWLGGLSPFPEKPGLWP